MRYRPPISARKEALRAVLAAAAAALFALFLVAALAAGAAAVPPGPIRLALATIAPEGTPWADTLAEVKRRIEKESQGRIRVALFLGGRRGSESETLTELRRGKIQGGGFSIGAVAGEVPELEVLEFPFLFRSSEEADHVIDEVIGRELVTNLTEKGLVVGAWSENGWRSIGTRKRAVRAPEDLRGLRVRSQENPVHLAFWKAFGANPTAIALTEVLSALQTGVIEGFDQTPLYMTAAGWHLHIKYFTLTEHSYQGACLLYNRRFLDSLPEPLRKIVLGDPQALTRSSRRAVREQAEGLERELAEARIELIRLDEARKAAFRARSAAVYEELKETPGGKLLQRVSKALAQFRARGGRAAPAEKAGGESGPEPPGPKKDEGTAPGGPSRK